MCQKFPGKMRVIISMEGTKIDSFEKVVLINQEIPKGFIVMLETILHMRNAMGQQVHIYDLVKLKQ